MASSQSSPNVVLVHSHDLGRHLGCYGRDVDTPNVDALADEGARFSDYFCTAPQCSPSRASIVTGQHPHEVGMFGLAHLGWEMDGRPPTLPGTLSEAGYDTHVFGVQHVAPRDPDAVADLGYDSVHSETMWSSGTAPLTGKVTPAVTDFLDERSGDEPFLATVGFFEPHRLGRGDRWDFDPRQPDQGGRWDFEGSTYAPDDPADVEEFPYLPDHPGIREDHAEFHGMIRAVDDSVGRIAGALEEAGLAEETLFVFTTDHGIPFPRAKGTCYDSGLGTALVMRGPGVESGVHDELLSNVDLMPTLLDHLDVPIPDDVSGQSFRPLLRGEEATERERVFAEMTYHLQYCPMRAVRTDRYKYVRNYGDSPRVYMPMDIRHGKAGIPMIREYYTETSPEEELYDLHEDPHEEENVAADPEYDDVLAELRREVDDWMAATDDPIPETVPDLPPAQREQFWSALW